MSDLKCYRCGGYECCHQYDCEDATAERDRLRAENKRLREALAEIADGGGATFAFPEDLRFIAREALAGKGGDEG